jgi:hypothetical protein
MKRQGIELEEARQVEPNVGLEWTGGFPGSRVKTITFPCLLPPAVRALLQGCLPGPAQPVPLPFRVSLYFPFFGSHRPSGAKACLAGINI